MTQVSHASHEAELSDAEMRIIVFEREWWNYAGSKELAIADTFELHPLRYYQVLNALIDRPEAERFDPMTVRRLRRARAELRQIRSRLGHDDDE